jgi:hypothetical protein
MHIRARARLRHLLFQQTKTKTRRQQTQSRGLISPVSTPAAVRAQKGYPSRLPLCVGWTVSAKMRIQSTRSKTFNVDELT